MILSFNRATVIKLLRDCEQRKAAPHPYAELSTTLQKMGSVQGLLLVGDQGIYLVPHGSRGEQASGQNFEEAGLVAYAEECNPHTTEGWYEVKRTAFGGDDGVEVIDLTTLLKWEKNCTGNLRIKLTPKKFEIALTDTKKFS